MTTAVSEQFPHSLNIIQLDNAFAHPTKSLQVHDNILLGFQPAHAPKLNPIERLWQHLKAAFAWQNYEDFNQLRKALA
ncbi:transposase [Leptothermofonsia sp. ETS-13]|uniref:transposase n=1 Tax=Leptothermofonsia sp. ETS-13 TaxID=3035696 RepID=UPI003BA3057E